MRILLTGHRGYIGSVLTPMLIEAGHDVVGLDSDLYRRCTFGDYRAIQGIPSLTKDIRDVEASDLDGFDALLHLAALSNDPLGNLNPELTKEINYAASIHLARLAKEVGIKRFIFASSCSNYGPAGQDWMDEESDLNPVTPYGESKVRVEKDLMNLADSSFSLTFSRSATVYGVSPRLRFDLVLNNLVAWALTTGRVRLKSDGMAWRPIIHIEDVSRAFIAMLNAPRDLIHNQTFNVGRTSENYRIRQLAEIVAKKVPGSRVEYAKGASRDIRSYRVDCSKLERTLPDFKPKWDASLGAEQLYKTFQKNSLTLEEFEGPKYKRVDHLKQLLNSGQLDETMRWKEG